MADAFAPSPFPPIAPKRVRPPPTREELRSYSRYRRTGGTFVPSPPDPPEPPTPTPLFEIWNDLLIWDDQYIWDE